VGECVQIDLGIGHSFRMSSGLRFDDRRVVDVGAALAAAANLEENSPNDRCWLRRSMRQKVAMSQKHVVPPLPSTTSYPSGRPKSSPRPLRSRPTTDLTARWRWLVPR